MATICDLPTELIEGIFSQIDDVPTYLHICLVNKSFLQYAEPFLYRNYQNLKTFPSTPLGPFMRRLVERPELAKHVKAIELRTIEETPRMMEIPMMGHNPTPLPEDSLNMLAKAAYSCGLLQNNPGFLRPVVYDQNRDYGSWEDDEPPIDEDWDNMDTWDTKFLFALQRGIEDALIILLVALCPRLQEILLRGMPWECLSWQALSRVKHGFKALRRFVISGIDGELEIFLGGFIPLFAMPSFRKLEVFIAGDVFEPGVNGLNTRRAWHVAPKTLEVRDLILQYCALSAVSMRNLVEGCKTLKSLNYSAGGSRVAPDQFNAQDLASMLQSHKRSLQHLKLDFSIEWDYYDRDVRLFTIGSLAEFESLTYLMIDQKMLFNEDNPSQTDLTTILPVSLEIFELAFISGDCVQPLLGLATHKSKLPRLERVNIYWDADSPHSDPGLDDLRILNEVYEKAKLQFEFCLADDIDEWSTARTWQERFDS